MLFALIIIGQVVLAYLSTNVFFTLLTFLSLPKGALQELALMDEAERKKQVSEFAYSLVNPFIYFGMHIVTFLMIRLLTSILFSSL